MLNVRRIGPAALGLLLLTGCYSLPSEGPGDYARNVENRLQQGDTEQAGVMFERIEHDDQYRNVLYPVLFDASEEAFELGDYGKADTFLAFLANRYPEGPAVAEALAMNRFLWRSEMDEPDADFTQSLGQALEDLRLRTSEVPVWVDLAETQFHLDEGDERRAARTLEHFLDRWDGDPAELLPYVEDLQRAMEDPEP